MRRLDMRPTLAMNDSKDLACAHSIHTGKPIATDSGDVVQSSYFSYLSLGKLGRTYRLPLKVVPQRLASMTAVFLWGAVFQIFETGVILVAVLVVDLITGWTWPYKYTGDNSMYFLLAVSTVDVEMHQGVLAGGNSMFQYPAIFTKSGNAPKIANLIDAFVSRYIAPIFAFQLVRGKLLVSHFRYLYSGLVRRTAGIPVPSVLCFVPQIIPYLSQKTNVLCSWVDGGAWAAVAN